jgi:phosphatidylserine/phosphatidylglycerophosphate/cardiolipin synthase-like enzyme
MTIIRNEHRIAGQPSMKREAVFVTSANLTEAALERNIEVGLFVRDRALAASLSSHFQGLIDRGLLYPLPMA